MTTLIDAQIPVEPYSSLNAEEWDAWVRQAPMGTFLHTRQFLAYHGERFQDVSLLLRDSKNGLLAVFPAALDLADPKHVISHLGSTFGGLIHLPKLSGERLIAVFKQILAYYREQGYQRLTYKVVPTIYHQSPASDDLYALFRLEATRSACNLASVIHLKNRLPVSERRRRSLKKALQAGVTVKCLQTALSEFWAILTDNLQRKYAANPVHTETEFGNLMQQFPEEIELVVAEYAQQIVAGVALFLSPTVMHAQYIAASDLGYKVNALDAVFEFCIQRAAEKNRAYFDFGTSNAQQGHYLNESLYQFKSEFGGGGVVYETYSLTLSEKFQ